MDRIELVDQLKLLGDDLDYLESTKASAIKDRLLAMTAQPGIIFVDGDVLKVVANVYPTIDVLPGSAIDINGEIITIVTTPESEDPARPARASLTVPGGVGETKYVCIKYAEINYNERYTQDSHELKYTKYGRSYEITFEDTKPDNDSEMLCLATVTHRADSTFDITDERKIFRLNGENPKNLLINSGFENWDRGSGWINPSPGSAVSDLPTSIKWLWNSDIASYDYEVSRTDSMYKTGSHSCKLYIAAGGDSYLSQNIDDFADYKGKRIAVSCWVKTENVLSTTPCPDAVAIRISDGVKTEYSNGNKNTTFNGHTSDNIGWERLSMVFDVDLSATELTIGLRLYSGGLHIHLDDVMAVAGSVPVDYTANAAAIEEQLCGQYFERSYKTGLSIGHASGSYVPADNSETGAHVFTTVVGPDYSHYETIRYKIKKASTPTVKIYAPATGTSDRYNVSDVVGDVIYSDLKVTDNSFVFSCAPGSNKIGFIHYVIDCEI